MALHAGAAGAAARFDLPLLGPLDRGHERVGVDLPSSLRSPEAVMRRVSDALKRHPADHDHVVEDLQRLFVARGLVEHDVA
jgi:hypothetical protein